MALEASARVAVTNAIENKEDLGRMLGMYLLCSCTACFIISIPVSDSPIVTCLALHDEQMGYYHAGWTEHVKSQTLNNCAHRACHCALFKKIFGVIRTYKYACSATLPFTAQPICREALKAEASLM